MINTQINDLANKGGQNRYKTLAQNLARSVYHWLCYVYNSTESDVLLESSVRFPLIEYLERREGIKTVHLEKKIEKYSHRAIDFYFEKRITEKKQDGTQAESVEASFYVEIKFVNINTGDSTIRQDVFDDLIRLRHYVGENIFCYFIMCGPTDLFETSFRRVAVFSERGKLPQDSQSKKRKPRRTIYNEWFSFDVNKPDKSISINKTSQKKFAAHFNLEYKDGPLRAQNFSSRLIQVFPARNDIQSPQSVGIWQILE